MSTTKYGFYLIEHNTTGWNGIVSSAIQQIESKLHTYLMYKVASGESIPPYRPVCIQNGQWKMAMDPDVTMFGESAQRLPVVGISMEPTTKGSGEWLRAQRAGPITNNSGENKWAWGAGERGLSGEVWINHSGELVQGVSGENWVNRQARIGVIADETTVVLQL